jgi:agmatine deiminase
MTTPYAQHYRMPAEWEPHAATWIAWPHNPDDWPGKFQPIPWVYCEIVRHLSAVEDVHILVNDAAAQSRATNMLRRQGANLARLHFHRWRTDRVWLRDSGPIFLKDNAGGIALTNWRFNAWAKYPNWHHDDRIPAHIAKLYKKMPSFEPAIKASASSSKAAASTSTARACCSPPRSACSPTSSSATPASRAQLEKAFRDYLGIEQTIWLNRGCAGDDTHGHVDDIARFVAPNTVLAAVEPNPADENHLPLAENLDRLHAARNLSGKPLTIRTLPMPAPVVFEGQRLPASYANFYIANSLVLVPTFNDPNDRIALNTLAECFPTCTVTGIHCTDLIWGLGALHCMTQQEPA